MTCGSQNLFFCEGIDGYNYYNCFDITVIKLNTIFSSLMVLSMHRRLLLYLQRFDALSLRPKQG